MKKLQKQRHFDYWVIPVSGGKDVSGYAEDVWNSFKEKDIGMTIERTIREVEDLLEDKNFFWLLRQNDTSEGRYFANICQITGSLPPDTYPAYGNSMVEALRGALKKFKESDHAID